MAFAKQIKNLSHIVNKSFKEQGWAGGVSLRKCCGPAMRTATSGAANFVAGSSLWLESFGHRPNTARFRPTEFLKNLIHAPQNRIDTLRAAGKMAVMPEENKKPSLAESLEKLESLREEMLDSAAVNQRVYDAVEKELGRIAREFFPGMNTCWQAEQFRELKNEISFLSSLYWQKLSSLDYQAKQSESP